MSSLKFSALFCFAAIVVQSSNAAIDWEVGQGFRSKPLDVPAKGKTGFTLLPPNETGILFTNSLSLPRQLRSHVLLNGSGVAAGDVDGDGWCDLYFCNLDGPNVLYRNLGNWKFQDITKEAGVACPGVDATGAAFVDLDGDGHLDLVVNSTGGGTHVFINDGHAHFRLAGRLNMGRGGTSLAFADIDGDGYLDFYIANYRTTMIVDMPNTNFRFKDVNGKKVISAVNGRPVTEPDLEDRFTINALGGIDEQGEVDMLVRNLRGTNVAVIPFTQGAFLDEEGNVLSAPPRDWGLSVMFRDINGDGIPDIYVCNDFDSPDRIWINQGNGTFRAAAPLAFRKLSLFSMGVDFADINRDGFYDIFVLDMLSRSHVRRLTQMPDRKPPVPVIGEYANRPQYTMNTLFLNRGDGTYGEVAQLAGVAASEWSWTPVFMDVDLDGWEDLLIANGHARDARNLDVTDKLLAMRKGGQMSNDEILEARKIFPPLAVGKLAFRNQRDLKFQEISAEWGFNTVGVSHGIALADLDNDGDQDVIVNNLNSAAGIYRNDSMAPRIAVRLKGLPPNTHGIGADIKVTGGPIAQSQEMVCGGRYLSSDEPLRVFAAGDSKATLGIDITWRSGKRSVITGARANRIYEIDETQAELRPRNAPQTSSPLFADASQSIAHWHQENAFDDFERQPLLPRKLSQLGPGVSWIDLDGDGYEGLIVGSGKGGSMAIFRNVNGSLTRMGGEQTAPRDQTAILGWPKAGKMTLLSGSASYEDGNPAMSSVREFDSATKSFADCPWSSGRESSAGPMAVADIDNDGNLDLFVGGRVIPGKYPEAASSVLFRQTAGKMQVDQVFEGIGLVSGAVFSDLNGDGNPDLVLACEWSSLRVLMNEHGKFIDRTEQLGVAKYRGLWNGVTTGDFDGDGKLDIAASNWGENSIYQSYMKDGMTMVFGDLDGEGPQDMMEAYNDPDLRKLVPQRMLSFFARGMPSIRERFKTYESFARASVQEICGEHWKNAKQLTANRLVSTVFLNRGDHFEAHALPVEAQMSPAFGICAADFDGDGKEDLFLSQNFFVQQPDTPRCDAGRGLLLQGDGHGNFRALSAQESGIALYGEQRGAAVCDYDGDGRVDLAVTQNGGETKLYHNARAKPGMRVRLVGSPGNPNAIGATLRVGAGEKLGPAREIHAGSGYWSEDSAVQVIASEPPPIKLWVRWPGGKITTSEIPETVREVSVDANGQIRKR